MGEGGTETSKKLTSVEQKGSATNIQTDQATLLGQTLLGLKRRQSPRAPGAMVSPQSTISGPVPDSKKATSESSSKGRSEAQKDDKSTTKKSPSSPSFADDLPQELAGAAATLAAASRSSSNNNKSGLSPSAASALL